jgi:lipopolysaccharide assembly protein A
VATTQRTRSGTKSRTSVGVRLWELLRRRWFAIVLAIVAVIFILQNRSWATIQLFTVQVSMPQWLILAIVLVVGGLLGYLLSRGRRGRR